MFMPLLSQKYGDDFLEGESKALVAVSEEGKMAGWSDTDYAGTDRTVTKIVVIKPKAFGSP